MPSRSQRSTLPPLGGLPRAAAPAPRLTAQSGPAEANAFEAWFFEALVSLTLDEACGPRKDGKSGAKSD